MKFATLRSLSCAAILGLSGLAADAKAGLTLTFEAAGVQSSHVAGVTAGSTETFTSFATGDHPSLVTAVGTITSPTPGAAIVVADQYGGAGGAGKYLAVGAQSGQTSASLALNGPQHYFGFWWSAADPNNSVQFLLGGNVVATYTSATALGSLGGDYYGNPNTGNSPSNRQDSGEKFAYVNFTGTGGTVFDQVIFSNAGTGTGFEVDNLSVLASVPEPSSLAMCGIAGGTGLAVARSRRKRPA